MNTVPPLETIGNALAIARLSIETAYQRASTQTWGATGRRVDEALSAARAALDTIATSIAELKEMKEEKSGLAFNEDELVVIAAALGMYTLGQNGGPAARAILDRIKKG